MKVFLIFWLCIQSPGISLEDTCVTKVQHQGYENLEQCKQSAVKLAEYVMVTPDVYLTTFCTTKEYQST
tara:strand:+ start:46 stop:252 length:207 start_codon:yes stop_codon:yes gene_type:complete